MEAIVFDWDGTLVDSLGAFHARTRRCMAAFGLPFDVVALPPAATSPTGARCTSGSASPTTGSTRRTGSGRRPSPPTATASSRSPGAPEALERLRDAGAALGIVTAGHRDVVEPQLERTGLGGAPAGPGVRRRPAGPQAGPGAAPAGPPARRPRPSARSATAYVGDAPTTCGWRAPSARSAIGIESVLGDPDELLAAGAAEVAPSVAAWVEAHLAARDGAPAVSRRRPTRHVARSSSPTATVPTGARPRPAWPGWADGVDLVSPPTAARATRRALGRRIDRWVGDGDSIGAGGARAARARPASDRPCAGRQGRDRTPSSRCSPRSGRRAADHDPRRASAATALDHELGQRLAARPPGPRRPRGRASSTAGTRGSACAGPGVRTDLGGRGRRPGLAAAVRRRRRGITTDGPPLPARATSRSGRAGARPVERPRRPPMPADRAPDRPAARRGDPCYAPGDEHARQRASWRPRSPFPTRPARSIGSPTSAAAGRSSTSTRRTTRPAARPRPASSATSTTRSRERGADVWGISPHGAASQRAFREKFDLPFSLLSDPDHAVAERYGAGSRSRTTARRTWASARPTFLVDPEGRIAQTWRRSSPRATPPRSWRPSTRPRRGGALTAHA